MGTEGNGTAQAAASEDVEAMLDVGLSPFLELLISLPTS